MEENKIAKMQKDFEEIKEKYSPQKKPNIDNRLEKVLQKTKKDISERKFQTVEEIERKVREKVDREYYYCKQIKDWGKLCGKNKKEINPVKKRNRIAIGSPSEDKKDKIKRFLKSYGGGIKPKYFEELRLSNFHPIETPSYFLIKPGIEKELSEKIGFSLSTQDYTEKALENKRKKSYTDLNSVYNYELEKALKLTELEKISKGFKRFVKGVKKSPRKTVEYLIAGKEKAKTIYQGLKELKKLYPEKEGIKNPDRISNLDILKFIGDPNREPIYKLTEGADNHNKEKSSEKLKLLGHTLISYHYPEEKYLRKTPKSVGERIISEKYLLEETIFETKMEVFTRLTDKGYSSEKITKRFQDAGFNDEFG